MLDTKTATLVRKAINKHFSSPDMVSLEAVRRMQPVVKNTGGNDYTILALQFGDLTILVWVQFSEKLGVMVRKVESQAW